MRSINYKCKFVFYIFYLQAKIILLQWCWGGLWLVWLMIACVCYVWEKWLLNHLCLLNTTTHIFQTRITVFTFLFKLWTHPTTAHYNAEPWLSELPVVHSRIITSFLFSDIFSPPTSYDQTGCCLVAGRWWWRLSWWCDAPISWCCLSSLSWSSISRIGAVRQWRSQRSVCSVCDQQQQWYNHVSLIPSRVQPRVMQILTRDWNQQWRNKWHSLFMLMIILLNISNKSVVQSFCSMIGQSAS